MTPVHKRMALKPGTLVDQFRIVDASGLIRFLPKDLQARARAINAVERKVGARNAVQERERLMVPKTLPRDTVIKILKAMGFVQKKSPGHLRFSHPRYRVVSLPSPGKGTRTGQINIRRSFLRRIITDYLLQGKKI